MAILARSFVGHSPKVQVVDREYTGLRMQVEAVLEALDSIADTFGHNTKVFLVGHSIGSWIILQVCCFPFDLLYSSYSRSDRPSNNVVNSYRASSSYVQR